MPPAEDPATVVASDVPPSESSSFPPEVTGAETIKQGGHPQPSQQPQHQTRKLEEGENKHQMSNGSQAQASGESAADSLLAHTPSNKLYYEDKGNGPPKPASVTPPHQPKYDGSAAPFKDQETRKTCRLFVGNLNTEAVTREEVGALFSKYGRILEVSFHRKYGFVQFEKPESVQAAMQAKGMILGGRPIDPQRVATSPHDVPERPRRGPEQDRYGPPGSDRDRDRDRRSKERPGRERNRGGRDRSPGRSRDRDYYGGAGAGAGAGAGGGAAAAGGANAHHANGLPTPSDGDVVKLLLLGRGQRDFAEETARVLERTGVPYKLEMPDGRNLGAAIRDWESNNSRYGVIVGNTSVRTQRVTMKFLREHDRSGKCYTVDATMDEMVDRILRSEEKLGFTYTPRGGAPTSRDLGRQHGYGGPPSYGQSAAPPHGGYGAPPPQSSYGYGAPPSSQGYGAPPPQAPPPSYGGYPVPPPQQQHQQPPPPYGAPPQHYGAPQPQPPYGAPPPQQSYYGQPQPPQAPPPSYGAPPPHAYGAPPPQHQHHQHHQQHPQYEQHQQGYGGGSNATPSGYRPPPPQGSNRYNESPSYGNSNANANRPPGGPYGSQLSSGSSIPPAGRNSDPPIKLTANQVSDLKSLLSKVQR